ncbi:MAG: hypothetical protein ACYDGR_15045 [Candidatus Dormibacteria bacterium]
MIRSTIRQSRLARLVGSSVAMSMATLSLVASPTVAHAAINDTAVGTVIALVTQTAPLVAEEASKVVGNCAYSTSALNTGVVTKYDEQSNCSDAVNMDITLTLNSIGPVTSATGTVYCRLNATLSCPASGIVGPTTLLDYQTLDYLGIFTALPGWTFNGTVYDTNHCTLDGTGTVLTCKEHVVFFIKHLGASYVGAL